MRARLEALLARPWLPAAAVGLGVLVFLPVLATSRLPDDWIHALRLGPVRADALFERAPGDLFVFSSGAPAELAARREAGVFGWWTAPDFKLAFWRPLAAATHRLDHALGVPLWVHHAHSLIWYGLLVAAVGLVYRRLMAPAAAALALLLYAVDDAHAVPVAFVANRNALIAGALGLAGLWAHDRWRRGSWRAGGLLAPVLLGLALLAGEAALGIWGYLVAYALFLDPGRGARARIASLAPAAAVALVWLAAYRAGGYGGRGSGVYLDPLAEPAFYLAALPGRLAALLAALFALPPADIWIFVPPGVRAGLVVWAVLLLAGLGWLLAPLLARSPAARFWAAGALFACLPVAATFPHDRLLLLPGIGGLALVALLAAGPEAAGLRRRPGRRAAAVALIAVHGLLAPLAAPLRVVSVETLARIYERADGGLPADSEAAGKTAVIVCAPGDGLVAYLPVIRQALGRPAPRRLRQLGSGGGPVEVVRTDERTLVLEAPAGFFGSEAERMLRGPGRPFAAGQRATLSDLAVTVAAVDAEGRPTRLECRFDRPLEDPVFHFSTWEGDRLVPFALPAVGERRRLAPVSLLTAVFGE